MNLKPLWLRVVLWVKENPWVAAVIALIFGGGIAAAQTRYYRTKGAKAQQVADIATAKAARAENLIREADGRAAARASDARAEEARHADKKAGEDVVAAGEELDALGTKLGRRGPRWPTKPPVLLLLALLSFGTVSAGGAWNRDAEPARQPDAPAPACRLDADRSGLLWLLDDMSGRLAQTPDEDPCPRVLADQKQPEDDLLAVCVAAATVRAYQRERTALCSQLEARANLVAELETGRIEREKVIEALSKDRALGWKLWEEEVARRQLVPSLGRFGWTAGIGLNVDTEGEFRGGAQVTYGFRW